MFSIFPFVAQNALKLGGQIPSYYIDPRNLSSPVPVSNGGTGAGNTTGAATNLNILATNSPHLTGVPTAPTANIIDSSTQLATTQFVHALVSSALTGAVTYKGSVDASAASISAAGVSGTPQTGWMYYVSTSGATAFGFQADRGDFLLYDGSAWEIVSGIPIFSTGSTPLRYSYFTDTSTTINTTLPVTIATLDASVYRSAEFSVQLEQGTNFYRAKVICLHNGSTVQTSLYGVLQTAAIVSAIDVSLSSGNLLLQVAMASSSSATAKTTILAQTV